MFTLLTLLSKCIIYNALAWVNLGCYKDNANYRDLNGFSAPEDRRLTSQKCVDVCLLKVIGH